MAISNSMSSFVPKYWLKWQILVAILMDFVDKHETTKVYIPVHPCLSYQLFLNTFCELQTARGAASGIFEATIKHPDYSLNLLIIVSFP